MSRNTDADSRSMPGSPRHPVDRAEREVAVEDPEWSDGMGGGPGSRDSGGDSIDRESEWQRIETDGGTSSASEAREYGEQDAGRTLERLGVRT